jgi:hypothetical protein
VETGSNEIEATFVVKRETAAPGDKDDVTSSAMLKVKRKESVVDKQEEDNAVFGAYEFSLEARKGDEQTVKSRQEETRSLHLVLPSTPAPTTSFEGEPNLAGILHGWGTRKKKYKLEPDYSTVSVECQLAVLFFFFNFK